MSPTNDMKARLFVDMDGTLAVWKQAACFEDLLSRGISEICRPIRRFWTP